MVGSAHSESRSCSTRMDLVSLGNLPRAALVILYLTKMFLKTLAIMGVFALAMPVSVRAQTDPLKVMSFNVRTSDANDPCPSGCWEQRQTRVQQMLAKYDPDFFGTQETAPIQTAFFNETLGYAAVGECAGPCGGNERNSIFYRAAKWELLSTETFALSDTPEVIPSNTWHLEYLRAAVMARFKSTTTGNTVCMLNTHYDVTRGHTQSSVLVASRFAQYCQKFDTAVLTGDLNTQPETKAIHYLEGKVELSGGKTPLPMYETLTAAGAGGATWIGNSFNNKPHSKKIDYVFARRDSHTCLQKGEIIADGFDGGFSSSDHAVVMSTFCIGEAGCTECLEG
jgi:endonuclease/exonuclease/phosphatase family metal-dependent hydrolase